MLSDQQLYIVIGAPMLFNVALAVMVVAYCNSRFNDLISHIDARVNEFRDYRAEARSDG